MGKFSYSMERPDCHSAVQEGKQYARKGRGLGDKLRCPIIKSDKIVRIEFSSKLIPRNRSHGL